MLTCKDDSVVCAEIVEDEEKVEIMEIIRKKAAQNPLPPTKILNKKMTSNISKKKSLQFFAENNKTKTKLFFV